MKHYATVVLISGPGLHNNNRAESDGNLVHLQEVSLGERQHTLINGEAIRRACRDGLTDLYGESRMFRVSDKTDTNSGYGYGNTHTSGSIEAGATEVGSLDELKKKVDVALFGLMSVIKGKDPVKLRSVVEVGRAISCSAFEGTALFTQGVNSTTGGIVPYNVQVHGCRYQYHITVDLDMIDPEAFKALLSVIFGGLKVGGNHARNAMSLVPDATLWTFYNVSGNNKLYTVGMPFPPDQPIDLTEYKALLSDRGLVDYKTAGVGPAFETKIGQAVDLICQQAEQFKAIN